EVRERRILMASISETNSTQIRSNTLLAGKVALVTGGSRGIGRAIALKLASLGADVAISGRDAAKLAESESAIRAAGVRTVIVVADVTRSNDVSKMIEKVEGEIGGSNHLIYHTGIGL